MNPSADTGVLEKLLELIAILHPNYEEVINGFGPDGLFGQFKVIAQFIEEMVMINRRNRTPLFVPFFQML